MKIIKFYSDICGPCKVLDSNLKKAGIEYESVNVGNEEDEVLVCMYNIKSVPTLIKEDYNGKVLGRHTGIMSVEQLKEWCSEKQ